MDGWNTILSYWVSAYFQVRTASFREGLYDLCATMPSPYLTYKPPAVYLEGIDPPKAQVIFINCN